MYPVEAPEEIDHTSLRSLSQNHFNLHHSVDGNELHWFLYADRGCEPVLSVLLVMDHEPEIHPPSTVSEFMRLLKAINS